MDTGTTPEPRCPHCGMTWMVARSTRADGQIIDLSARCSCGARVDASGIGDAEAVAEFNKRCAARTGTAPEGWRIPVRPAGARTTTRRRGPGRGR